MLGLYEKFHDRWFLADTFEPLLRWNRWWAEHRDMDGYLVWGSNDDTQPQNPDDGGRGTRGGAILESGLDNSPMYDTATYNHQTHQLEFADVGLMGLYVADCDALAKIADVLGKTAEARELRDREARYKAKLQTMWDEKVRDVSESRPANAPAQPPALAHQLLSAPGRGGDSRAGADHDRKASAQS